MSLAALAAVLAAQDAEYFPLQPGNAWSYRMSTGQTMEAKVVDVSNVGGQRRAVLETILGPQRSREHLAVTREGLTSYKIENANGAFEYPTPLLRAKLPFKHGDTWQVSLQEGPVLNTYHYRTEGPEKVGDLEAWKVTATLRLPQGGQAVVSAWYARGLGLVKQVYDLNGQVMTVELSSTSLKPAEAKGPRRCAKCEAVDKAGGKFCAECAAPFPRD